jgi:hypothetical protein
VTKLTRSDSQYLVASNEGHVIFLYDEANAQALRELSPALLGGFDGTDGRDDAAMVEAARRGLLLAYQLQGDTELRVELSLGAPLSEAERQGRPWRWVQQGFLHAPSGELALEGYDSLRLGEEEPMSEGARAKVAPGDYEVTVHWLDILELPEDYSGPYQLITLRPGAHRPDHKPVLHLEE